jgi:hypothetical protein
VPAVTATTSVPTSLLLKLVLVTLLYAATQILIPIAALSFQPVSRVAETLCLAHAVVSLSVGRSMRMRMLCIRLLSSLLHNANLGLVV